MKPWIVRFFAALGIVAVLAAVPVSCISAATEKKVETSIDKGMEAVDAVLASTGNAALIPVAHAAGGVAKWVTGLFTVGGAAAGSVAMHAKHGGSFTPNTRRRKKQIDRHWDDLLLTAQNLVPQLTQIAAAAGDTHAQRQAQQALNVLGALKAAQPVPTGA
jgi:hypothetical protein